MDASFLLSSFKPLPKGSYRENTFNGVEGGGVILFKISLKKLHEETENCHCEMYTKAS